MAPSMTTALPPALPQVPDRYREHRRRLLQDRAFRLEQLSDLDRDSGAPRSHPGVSSALRIAASTALHEIDDALDRLATGTYGVCTGCGTTIPADRLEALPMAPLCTSCHYNEQNCRISRRLAPPA